MKRDLKVESLQPGIYVVAVSGGVDSVVLLDILVRQKGLKLVVAHYDHGIRKESRRDRIFVQNLAKKYDLEFVFADGNLGSKASEDRARQARYKFLRQIRSRLQASAIVTAHHQDDVLETGIINLLRGTGWRGLASLRSTSEIIRPFLTIPKADIVDYAKHHKLQWQEDSTNSDEKYFRNYIRGTMLPCIDVLQPDFRTMLLGIIYEQWRLAAQIDKGIEDFMARYVIFDDAGANMPRYQLIMLPATVAEELLQAVFRKVTGKSVERKLLRDALLFTKVAKAHKVFELNNKWQLRATAGDLFVEPRTTVIS